MLFSRQISASQVNFTVVKSTEYHTKNSLVSLPFMISWRFSSALKIPYIGTSPEGELSDERNGWLRTFSLTSTFLISIEGPEQWFVQ